MWFIGMEVEQETSAPPPKKNPGSAPGYGFRADAKAILPCVQTSPISFVALGVHPGDVCTQYSVNIAWFHWG